MARKLQDPELKYRFPGCDINPLFPEDPPDAEGGDLFGR